MSERSELHTQLRLYCEYLEEAYPDVAVEEVRRLGRAVRPEQAERRPRGLLVAMAAAGITLLLIGGVALGIRWLGAPTTPATIPSTSTTSPMISTTTTPPSTTTTSAGTTTTAAAVVPAIAEGTWRVFTTADGLPAGDYAILSVGPDGTLWAAFPGALARLDGEQWTAFPAGDTIPEGQREWLVVMPDGLVVVNIGGTLVGFDGSEWQPQTLPDGSPVQLNPYSSVARLADDGTLWVAEMPVSGTFGRGRVLRFDGGVWSAWDGPTLTQEVGRTYWITEITPDGTVWFVESGTAWRQQRDRIDRSDLPTTGVTCCTNWVTVTADETVWVYAGYGVSRFDPSTSTWTHYGVEDGLLGPYPIYTGIPTSDGSLWLNHSANAADFANGSPYAYGLPGYVSPGDLPEGMALFPEGVSHFDGEHWDSYSADAARAAGIPIGTSYPAFTGYATGDEGSTWALMRTQTGGPWALDIYRHDGVSWSVVDAPVDALPIATDYSTFLAVTPDGTACLAAPDGQIACFTPA